MAESNPPQDPFEIFLRLWSPLGLPVPGMAVPTLNPKDVEKRIAELRSVESWLQVNLNMVQFAIRGLEVQRSALLAMGAGAQTGAPPGALAEWAATSANTAAGSMMWPWAVLQQAMAGKSLASETPPPTQDTEEPEK